MDHFNKYVMRMLPPDIMPWNIVLLLGKVTKAYQ